MAFSTRPRAKKRPLRSRFGLLAALAILLALIVQPALAQNLQFSVPVATVDLFVNEDGTVSLAYTYLFQNAPSGGIIDIVDIGMPTSNYSIASIDAKINGQPAELIRVSEYVDPGVEIHLGRNSIRPGQSGELWLYIGKIEGMLFKADTEEAEAYASFQFEPNTFGSDFVSGTTDLTVTLYLPPGLNEDEPRYFPPERWPGTDEPEAGYDEQGRVFYRWQSQNASTATRYVFGSAFPARLVPSSVLLTEVPFRINSEALCPLLFCLGFFGFIAFTIFSAIVGERKRRLQYLPPRVAVEGNGIKRGLTAVEAAIVMQQPMDKILTMILFSVVKRGVATVVSRDPMKIQVSQTLPDDLRRYEENFLEAMAKPQANAQRAGLQNLMAGLVQSVAEKMRGFSSKETIAYYQDIMNKAWQQVEMADTPELKMQQFDEAMDWTMLDRRFNDRTRDVFSPRPVILPPWWGRYDPTYGRGMGQPTVSGPTVSTAGNRPPQGVSLPNLPGSDFAASMVGGMQSFASNVVGDLTSFTGAVTQKTNPVPKTTSSSGRPRGGGGGSGGSSSCACACACAGCACACAGGGR